MSLSSRFKNIENKEAAAGAGVSTLLTLVGIANKQAHGNSKITWIAFALAGASAIYGAYHTQAGKSLSSSASAFFTSLRNKTTTQSEIPLEKPSEKSSVTPK